MQNELDGMIHDKHCGTIAAIVQLLLVKVRDAESPEARNGGFMFSPVHCDALNGINSLLGNCIEVLDTSNGIEREPVMDLAEMLQKGVDVMLDVAQRCDEEEQREQREELLNYQIHWFYATVRFFEMLEKKRLTFNR